VIANLASDQFSIARERVERERALNVSNLQRTVERLTSAFSRPPLKVRPARSWGCVLRKKSSSNMVGASGDWRATSQRPAQELDRVDSEPAAGLPAHVEQNFTRW
jgi:hypothetical protein